MKHPKLANRIVRFVHSTQYRPMKPKGFIDALGLDAEEYPDVRRTVKDLVKQGLVRYASNHLVLPADSKVGNQNQLIGTFRQARGGYGFVRPLPVDRDKSQDDVFIPEAETLSAMEGDTVEIRFQNGRGGKLEGQILKIVERARRQFTGSFELIEDKPHVWLDVRQLEQPVSVGDIRGLPVNDGDKVIVELVRFPAAQEPGEGIIMEVLGNSKNPAVDTVAVMFQYGLPESFPDDVIEDARKQADQFREDEIPQGRRDLRDTPTLTIDPFDARDFDDAISLSKNSAGHWELLVHIADVSHFVPEDSPLDIEARQRATSVYLPDRVVPMIPEIISNHLASLQPDKPRYAKTIWIEYTPDGTLVSSRVWNSVIRNAQRLNYEQVDQFLADRRPWKNRLAPEIFQLLSDMHELAMTLRRRRQSGGSLELTLPEIKIDLDRSGKVKGAHLTEHTESHQMIEEFMLAGNQAVATWLDDLKLPFLRRAHAPPARTKLRRLTEFVQGLGIQCQNLENRFEIQRVIAEVAGTSAEYAVNFAVLKSMSKALYQPDMERHYALDMTHYCHFTSPIRRYPDLVVHRIVQKLIDGQPAKEPLPKLIQLGEHCSDREQNAEAAERELIHIKLLHFMNKKVGQEMHGHIIAVRPNEIVVRCREIPAEGIVPATALPQDRYRFNKSAHTLEGYRKGNSFRLGDELIVVVHQVNLARRQLIFAFQSHAARPRLAKDSKKPRRKSARAPLGSRDGNPGRERPGKSNQKVRTSKRKSPSNRSTKKGTTSRKTKSGGVEKARQGKSPLRARHQSKSKDS